MNAQMLALFSGFPTHHFTLKIAETLKEELRIRKNLVFVTCFPEKHQVNDEDSTGMHTMFVEYNLGFENYAVIDDRMTIDQAQKLINEANCIFLMGGDSVMQMQFIHDIGIYDAIRASNAVILGVSAGSMNMGKHPFDFWESLMPYEGLGFVDLTVKCHYETLDDAMINTVMQVSMKQPIIAMEDESAIYITADGITSTGKIYQIKKGKIDVYTP